MKTTTETPSPEMIDAGYRAYGLTLYGQPGELPEGTGWGEKAVAVWRAMEAARPEPKATVMKTTTESDAQQPLPPCKLCGSAPEIDRTSEPPSVGCWGDGSKIRHARFGLPEDIWRALMSPDQSILLKVAEAVKQEAYGIANWTLNDSEMLEAIASIDLPAIIQRKIEEK